MKKCKKMLAILMSGAVLITGGALPQKNAAAAQGAADYGISNPRIENGVTTWDKIKFGSYYRDAEEKEAVKETAVVNEGNPYYYTEGGNDTKDKVYLLSIAEACNAAYGFGTEFSEDSKTREAKNTDYAKVNNVWSIIADGTVGNGYWWLRSPGSNSRHASNVNDDGYGDSIGSSVDNSKYGVRPALHINLSSSSWSKAGLENPAESAKPTQTTPPSVAIPEPAPTEAPALKKLKLSSVKCVKNTNRITGKVSVSKASVK